MPAVWRVHSPFFQDFIKKLITQKLYEIKTWNSEHTFSNVSTCDIVSSSLLDIEEHHSEHREVWFLSWYYFALTRHFRVGILSFIVGGILISVWFFIFPSSLPGGSFFWGTFWWSRCRCSTRALRLVKRWWRWWCSIWCVYQIFCDIWHEI